MTEILDAIWNAWGYVATGVVILAWRFVAWRQRVSKARNRARAAKESE